MTMISRQFLGLEIIVSAKMHKWLSRSRLSDSNDFLPTECYKSTRPTVPPGTLYRTNGRLQWGSQHRKVLKLPQFQERSKFNGA
jgi:hypothetical protein